HCSAGVGEFEADRHAGRLFGPGARTGGEQVCLDEAGQRKLRVHGLFRPSVLVGLRTTVEGVSPFSPVMRLTFLMMLTAREQVIAVGDACRIVLSDQACNVPLAAVVKNMSNECVAIQC